MKKVKKIWKKVAFKAGQALLSRTFWVVVLISTIAAVQASKQFLSPKIFYPVIAFLTSIAGYFKVNPSQDYSK